MISIRRILRTPKEGVVIKLSLLGTKVKRIFMFYVQRTVYIVDAQYCALCAYNVTYGVQRFWVNVIVYHEYYIRCLHTSRLQIICNFLFIPFH